MKILITTDWYKPVINGVVTSIINLEDELRRQGHEVKYDELMNGQENNSGLETVYICKSKS